MCLGHVDLCLKRPARVEYWLLAIKESSVIITNQSGWVKVRIFFSQEFKTLKVTLGLDSIVVIFTMHGCSR